MRRSILWSVVLLAGCAGGERGSLFGDMFDLGGLGADPFDLQPTPQAVPHAASGLVHRSAAFSEAEGVRLATDDEAWIGMSSMACRVQTMDGMVGADLDPDPERPERVTDAAGNEVIATTADHVHVITRADEALHSWWLPGVIDAGLADDGLVALADDPDQGCQVQLPAAEGVLSVEVPERGCAAGTALTIDPEGPTVWVPTADGAVRVDLDGATPTEVAGDLLAWDAATATLYAADIAASTVRAFDAQAELRWETPLNGTLADLEVSGAKVAVLVDLDGKGAEVWLLDAASGAASLASLFRAPVTAIAASPSGRTLAVTSRGQVDFFDVLD